MGNKEELSKPILIEDLGMMFPTEKSKNKVRFGLYKCGLCGTEFKTAIASVKRKHTNSCGCYLKRRASETHKTHGLGATRLYSIWSKLKGRVLNPKNKDYNDYGGRGINICEDWLDIRNFYDWAISNGYLEGLSLDRIDNGGNYCPENCRWVTKKIQNRNTRRLRKDNTVGYRGVTKVTKKSGTIRYVSKASVDGKKVYIGSFGTALEGAIAYDNYIIGNNLEHTTNFNRKGDYK